MNLKALTYKDVQGIRQRLGLSQAKFASAHNISKRTIQAWEQGRPIGNVGQAFLRLVRKGL